MQVLLGQGDTLKQLIQRYEGTTLRFSLSQAEILILEDLGTSFGIRETCRELGVSVRVWRSAVSGEQLHPRAYAFIRKGLVSDATRENLYARAAYIERECDDEIGE